MKNQPKHIYKPAFIILFHYGASKLATSGMLHYVRLFPSTCIKSLSGCVYVPNTRNIVQREVKVQ